MNRAYALGTLVALAVFLVGGAATARPDRGTVLKVAVATGEGRVMTSDGRLDCRTSCSVRYPRGKIRKVTASPADRYLFERWYGDCIGTAPTCEIALDRRTSVRAGFVGAPAALQISVGGPGHVTSDPAGLDCGQGGRLCQTTVPHASTVTLTPVPGTEGRFAAWDGACAAAGSGPCTVRIEDLVTQTAAAFGHTSPQAGDQPLTVTVNSSSTKVTSQPAGIDCPPACTAFFPSGTIVTLHRNFGLWYGACRGEDLDRCVVVVDAPTEVGLTPPPPPAAPPPPIRRVDVTVSGPGQVRSRDGQIQCGFTPRPSFRCQMIFRGREGTKLPLRANPRPRARFVRWGGSCRGRKATCMLALEFYGRNEYTLPLTGLFRSPR